eukprot:15373-Rhodomonas_salina.1
MILRPELLWCHSTTRGEPAGRKRASLRAGKSGKGLGGRRECCLFYGYTALIPSHWHDRVLLLCLSTPQHPRARVSRVIPNPTPSRRPHLDYLSASIDGAAKPN